MAIALPLPSLSQRRSSHPGLVRHVATMQPHTGAADGIHGAGSLVVAAAQGGLAYALLAPKWFARVHPVWGGIFAVLAVINLADAVD